jgi:PAS domain S-box-containing protein
MHDKDQAKEELARQVQELRQRIARLETLDTERKRAEEAQTRADQEKEMILDSLVEHVVHQDQQMKILWANRAACAYLGLSREDLIGQTCHVMWAGSSEPCPDCPVRRAMETGRVHEVEKATSDGRWWYIRGYPVKDQEGTITGGVEITLDITERKRAEEALRQSQEVYRILVQTSPDAVTATDLEGQITFVSPRTLELMGYEDAEEMLGRNALELVAPEDRHRAKADMKKTLRQGIITGAEHHLLRQDGTTFTGEFSSALTRDAQGNPQGLIATLRDITERRETEAEVRRLKEFNEGIVQNMTEGIVMQDAENNLSFVNPAAAAMLGYEPDELTGHHWRKIVPVDQQPIVSAADGRRIKGQSDRYEVELQRKDGTRLPVLVSGSPIVDADSGEFEGILAVFTDITDRVQAQEEVARRAREMAALYETSLEINAQPDLSTLLEAIVQRASDLVGAGVGGLYLMRPDRQELELVVGHNMPKAIVGTRLRMGEGLSGRVAQSGESMMIADYSTWDGQANIYVGQGFRRVLGVPMRVGDRVTGVINVSDYKRTGFFDKEDIRLVGLFADQAAIAIETARLFEAEREQRELAEALREASAAVGSTLDLEQILDHILEQVDRVIPNDAVNVNLVTEGRARIVRWRGYERFGHEISALALKVTDTPTLRQMQETGKALVISDTTADPEWVRVPEVSWVGSYAGAPIQVQGVVIGFLNADSATPGFFSQAHAERLQAFADQVSLALQNARLYLETQQRLADLSLVFDTSAAVSTSLDADTVLEATARQITSALMIEGCTIYRWQRKRDSIVCLVDYSPDLAWWQPEAPGTVYHLADYPTSRQVLCERQPLVVQASDSQADPAELAWMAKEEVQTVLMVPMIVRDEAFGVLEIMQSTQSGERVFTPTEIALCQTLANQAAAALENARLFREMRRRVDHLATLSRIGLSITAALDLHQVLNTLYDQIRHILDVGAFYVALYDEVNGTIEFPLLNGVNGLGHVEPLNIDQNPGITGYVIRTKEPLYLADTWSIPDDSSYQPIPLMEMPTRSYVGVPLLLRERVTGVLSVQSYEPDAYTLADVALLTTIASQASIAIDNARLFQVVEGAKREWESTFDAMQDAIVLLDNEQLILRANQAFAGLVQAELPQIVGRQYHDILHGAICRNSPCPLEQTSLDGEPAICLHDYNGRAFEMQATLLPKNGSQATDRPLRTILVMRDVSERLRAEEEIRRRNQELALLNRVIAASAASHDIKSILETLCCELALYFGVPQSASALFDNDRGGAIVVAEYLSEGRPPSLGEIIPVKDNPSCEYLIEHKAPLVVDDAQQDPRLAQVHELMRRRGTRSLLLLPLIVEGKVVGTLGVDAIEPRSFSTEEVNLAERIAEQAAGALARARLEETQQRLSAAVEQSAEAVFITETDGTILYVNPAFERISGYSRAEAIGQNPRLLKSGQHDLTYYRDLWQTISEGWVWQGRLKNRRKDGNLFTEEATITPIRNQANDIVNYVATMRDVTRETQLEEQFHQAQKMEALGQMAGGIAHDFNNLLTVIHLSTRLLQRQLLPQDPLWDHVQRIRETGDKATSLTKQLLSFSRREVVEPQVLELNQVVEVLSRMLKRIIGEDIQLMMSLADHLWPVEMDPTQIDQIIVNLVVNARDAMPDGGTLTIETKNLILDEAYLSTRVDAQPGRHVVLSISDTGVGMDEEIKAHIFEPFFTTKQRGQGTGLGLPTVFGIVTQNKGHIRVYSEPGMGTTVRIYLPCTEKTFTRGTAPPQPLRPASAKLVRGTETVLVVEDERDVRNLAVQVLRSCGYRVLAAPGGPEALQISQDFEDPIDLLLTDVVMPKMNGQELAAKLQEQRPAMQVLYMSGYADDAIMHHGILSAGAAFLSKPLTIEALTHKVRALLDGRL